MSYRTMIGYDELMPMINDNYRIVFYSPVMQNDEYIPHSWPQICAQDKQTSRLFCVLINDIEQYKAWVKRLRDMGKLPPEKPEFSMGLLSKPKRPNTRRMTKRRKRRNES
jgi:hypothetical protein